MIDLEPSEEMTSASKGWLVALQGERSLQYFSAQVKSQLTIGSHEGNANSFFKKRFYLIIFREKERKK